MKVEFPSVPPSIHSTKFEQVRKGADETRYQSFFHGIRYSGPTSPYDLFSGIFRILTFIFHFLFVSTPKLSAIYIPDLTQEKIKEYEKMLGEPAEITLLKKQGLGPSRQQIIHLLHQFWSFQEHLDKWQNVKNGHGEGMVTIDINGNKQTLFDFNFGLGEFLGIISNPKNYERGKPSKIVLSFHSKCVIDRGFGPFRVKNATLTCTNTLEADGKSITIEQTKKKLRSRNLFFPSYARAPLRDCDRIK